MSWQHIVVISFMVFGTLVSVATVGKERKPLEPLAAVFVILFNATFIYLIITG